MVMRLLMKVVCLMAFAGCSGIFWFQPSVHAQDRIMGQIQFVQSSKVAKTSGVWIDGQYVGFVGELKGSNRLRLLPGDHDITVRQAGYYEFHKKVVVEPRGVVEVRVGMERDTRFVYPDRKTSSEVRLDIQPSRAAVFLDDVYVGTVDEYYGIQHAMLVAPGKHRFKIALPGFRTFETELVLFPRQKFALRTNLMAGSINDADPSIRYDVPDTTSAREGDPKTAR
jgi:hypothetical protein